VIDRRALLKDLQIQVRLLEKDLRDQISELDDVNTRLRREYNHAAKIGRTAATWTVWRDERVTQAAVAWVLGTVFVRFCEDNGLFGDACYLTGPDQDRAVMAEESQEDFFRRHKEKTDRDWILAAFEHIGGSQAGRLLFDPKHNAAYQVPISHDAAKALIAFWRRRDSTSTLTHSFADPEWNTRFLGDLYQDLSEAARKNFALLQTPEFVEEFILDLTLTPAIEEFGYDAIKAIDPTCGSGHFLLEIFRRLVAQWEDNTDSHDRQEIARLALEAVHGVDINPFAVAIARFRLMMAALRVAGFETLEQASRYTFPIQIAVGDSLIKNRELTLFDDVDELAEFKYFTEDADDYPDLIMAGRYHVVVGNPPYITVKDKRLNELYRTLYSACSGKYALSVPFAQRFFELATTAGPDGRGSGYVGQITANSFMKREFGRRLIEQFFANEVDLTHIIDTSGAYIPSHGTPTTILVGRQRRDSRADTIRTVMGIRGEPTEPADPAQGLVWRAIVEQVNHPGSESIWVSVADVPRSKNLARFPWSLSGGGASSIIGQIDRVSKATLNTRLAGSVGFYAITGDDEVFTAGLSRPPQWAATGAATRPYTTGDHVRDWNASHRHAIWPYDDNRKVYAPLQISPIFWPYRTGLRSGLAFGKTREQRGMMWHEYTMLSWPRVGSKYLITFACVATHNHFALTTGRIVHNRHAPVIRLTDNTTREDHLALLGTLNSSTACFWLKQVSHDKGSQGINEGFKSQDWERFYEFTGTKLQEFPLPPEYPLELTRQLDEAAQRLTAHSPVAVVNDGVPTAQRLAEAKAEWESTRARMIALQEELDWQVYRLYGLLREELTSPASSVPELKLGERAFEIVLARQMAAGEANTQWFARHGSTPITEFPNHWPAEYREMVERRIQVIESNRYLALIERPECKRRWATDGWDSMCQRALRDWLLDRCEARELWYSPDETGQEQPRPMTLARLADALLLHNPDAVAGAELYAPGRPLSDLIAELSESEHVPYLAALRYTDPGLAKRADWETVWDLQREEDAAPDEPAKRRIRERTPVPPKYKPADFRKQSFWSNRGKLDVPKERFISYPHASHEGDPTLLLGWAGWNHQEQAQALAVVAVEREHEDGWAADRLIPLLAGLREVLPWVRQWHGEFDPLIGDSPAEVYQAFLTERMHFLHLTDQDLDGWRPPSTARGRRRA
jgi:hypothetical protein